MRRNAAVMLTASGGHDVRISAENEPWIEIEFTNGEAERVDVAELREALDYVLGDYVAPRDNDA